MPNLTCFLFVFNLVLLSSAVEHTYHRATPAPGYLVSENWPINYPHNYQRAWTLQSFDSNYVVVAQALATNIERDSTCRWDYVQVYDGPDSSSTSLGRFCGYSRPLFSSTNQSLTITFTTDDTRTASGFKIKYWCGLKPGVKLKSLNSETENTIAVVLATIMFVTLSFFCIITCCHGSSGRHCGMPNIRHLGIPSRHGDDEGVLVDKQPANISHTDLEQTASQHQLYRSRTNNQPTSAIQI